MNTISKSAIIGKNVSFGGNVFVGDQVQIEDNCSIGRNTIVNNTIIKSNTRIEENCNIGYGNATGWVSRVTTNKDLKFDPLLIGEGCLIREGCTLYVGSVLEKNVKIHHKTLVREKSSIGENTSIGSMCDLEGHLKIGENCSIHSNCHLCFDTEIGDYVFIAPFCVTTNGNPMSYKRPALYEKFGYEKGPKVGSGCQIAVHVTLLPRIILGHECLVGANSVVSRDAPPCSILVGTPARIKGKVEELHRLPMDIRIKLGLHD